MTNRDNLYQIADELRATAALGLRFTDHGYDHERYEKILQASARIVAELENAAFEPVYAQYTDNLAHLSPLPTVEAVVVRESKILLIQRTDDQLWAVPGGLCEVGESIGEAAVRELWEEAGVRGEIRQLMGIYDSRKWPVRTRMQLHMAQFLLHSDDEPRLHDSGGAGPSPLAEALDVGFFDEQHLPPLSYGHAERIAMAFKILRGEVDAPYFDR